MQKVSSHSRSFSKDKAQARHKRDTCHLSHNLIVGETLNILVAILYVGLSRKDEEFAVAVVAVGEHSWSGLHSRLLAPQCNKLGENGWWVGS